MGGPASYAKRNIMVGNIISAILLMVDKRTIIYTKAQGHGALGNNWIIQH